MYVEIERTWGMTSLGDVVILHNYPVLIDGQYPPGTIQAEQGYDDTPQERMPWGVWLERCAEFGLNPDGSPA